MNAGADTVVIATDCKPGSVYEGAWVCVLCGFTGFWRGGNHCIERTTFKRLSDAFAPFREVGQ